jgi:DNA end-binding protein Ku
MQQLHHDYEVRSFEDVPVGEAEVKGDELQLAIQLIKQSVADEFDPSKYHDEVRERVEALIGRKVEGEDITEAPAETPKAQVIDLMEALKASLGQSSDAAGGAEDEGQARKGPQRSSKASAKGGKKRGRTKKTAKR